MAGWAPETSWKFKKKKLSLLPGLELRTVQWRCKRYISVAAAKIQIYQPVEKFH
jgi:hypothetical protein